MASFQETNSQAFENKPLNAEIPPDSALPLLQNATHCYTHTDPSATQNQPAPTPADPQFPRPEPSLNSLQLLQKHTQSLSPQQAAAVSLLVAGRSDTQVAAALGIHRTTVTRWRLYNHVFQAEMNRLRSHAWTAAADRIRNILTRAVRVFVRQIRSDDHNVAFRAARALLQLAGTSRFLAPPDAALAPHDPFSVLDLEARKVHIQLCSIDPRLEILDDDERATALRHLLNKAAQHPLAPDQQEAGA